MSHSGERRSAFVVWFIRFLIYVLGVGVVLLLVFSLLGPPRWPVAAGMALMLLSVAVLMPLFARLHGGIIAAVALVAACLIATLPHGSSLDPPLYSILSWVLPGFLALALMEGIRRVRARRLPEG